MAANLKENNTLFGNPDTANPSQRPTMAKARFNFVVRNYNRDSIPYLATMQGPVLALWGEYDKNVDPIYNPKIYKQYLDKMKDQQTLVIKNATHGLLNANWFNYQLPNEWPFWKKVVFVIMGRHGYASGALTTISQWIHRTVRVTYHQ
ncbi:alpha/beta fold hydrolase [Celerinatantimonas yamalensis]|uniref:Uncharacterized protein n=1 Tax=Celerinatantimonas yamalensis TaxID=559956 RepID=A0ABW9G8Q8_9GAMM